MRQARSKKSPPEAKCPKQALEMFGDYQTLSIVDTLALG